MNEHESGNQPQQPDTPEQPLSGLAQAVSDAQPKADKPFAYLDEHTPTNTPMKDMPAPQSASKRELDWENDRVRGFTTMFLGNGKLDNKRAQELIGMWLGFTAVKDMHAQGKASDEMLVTATNSWEQFLEKEYPNRTSAEMQETAISFYKFMNTWQDDILLRSRLVREDGISNVSNRGGDLLTSDIVPKLPGANVQGFGMADVMTRGTARESETAYHYSVLCRNSFLAFTFARFDKLELASLINDINRTVRGYVRRVGHNSMVLASMAGMWAVWKWIRPRILSSSVEGLADFNDLARLIRITDMHAVYSAILAAATDEGVQMDLRCINAGCDWHKFDLVDPTKFVNVRYSIQTPEEAATFGNIFSDRRKYTPEEILAMIEKSTYGLETNKVYNSRQSVRLTIAPPSIADAFATFEYFVGQVEPMLADARTKVIEEEALEEQIAIILAGLGSCELMHWVSEFTLLPGGMESGNVTTFKRADAPSDEFNKGLMGSLRIDKKLDKDLTLFVYNKAPFMTRTFTGLRNYKCPVCGSESHELQEEDRQLGYTPIDAFMTFFTHTQLMLMDEAARNQEVTKEALS